MQNMNLFFVILASMGAFQKRVINRTAFYDKLSKGQLNLPQENKIEGSEKVLPYVFIGDEDFAMRNDFLIPF